MPFLYTFQASIDIDNKNAWKQCFSVKGIHLPTGLYFGATAATGDLAGRIAHVLYHFQQKTICHPATEVD